jgi:hypothetical protein
VQNVNVAYLAAPATPAMTIAAAAANATTSVV